MVFRRILKRMKSPAPAIRVHASTNFAHLRRTLRRLVSECEPESIAVVAPRLALMSPKRRQRIRDIAAEFGVTICEQAIDRPGAVVVDMEAGVDVVGDWLTPLLAELQQPGVRAVAPLVLHLDGTIAAAGWADGQPWLAGLTTEDAQSLSGRPMAGLGSACVVHRIGGTTGELRLVPQVWVRQHADVAPSQVYTDQVAPPTPPGLTPVAGNWSRLRAEVSEPRPHLRWALKNPAPSGQRGEKWGDTHFARLLADALRTLGQEVVIDHRGAFGRSSGHLDDVVLVLRGLEDYAPRPEHVNMLWLISHPELVDGAECHKYDVRYAASDTFCARHSDWGLRPLLQCTDPARFSPALAQPDSGDQVLFVGNNRGAGRPIVHDAVAAGLPLSVYGWAWADLLPPGVHRARHLPHADLGAAYRAAGMVLGDHAPEMASEGFISNRIFDAVASGARTVSDPVVGLHNVLPSVQIATDPTDLVVLWQERHSTFGTDHDLIAAATHVREKHSFEQRAQVLLSDAIEVWREKLR